MTVIYQQGEKRRSGPEGTLRGPAQALWDWGDNWDAAKRRIGQDENRRRFDAQFSAEEEARKARQAIQNEEMGWAREDRDRERLGRKADADIAQELIRGQRPGGPPPEYGPQMPEQQGPTEDGRPLGPEARIADSERRKWDAYEQYAADPNVPLASKRILFAQLAQEGKQKLADAQWGTLTRRFAGLTQPSTTSRGSPVLGLNAEDPEQAQLLSNIQSLIEQRADPEGTGELIAELEAEILRDARALERREDALEGMTTMMASLPPFIGPEARYGMQAAWQRFQRDQGMDPEEAWDGFLDAMKSRPGGRAASTSSPQGAAQPQPNGSNLVLPHYQTDIAGREKAIKALSSQLDFGNPTEPEVRARMDLDNPQPALAQGMAKGRIAAGKQHGGESVARQDVGAAAEMMGAGPASTDARTQRALASLDKPATQKRLSGAVEGAESIEDAEAALQQELMALGFTSPEQVPPELTRELLSKWRKRNTDKMNVGIASTSSGGERTLGLGKPPENVPPLDFGTKPVQAQARTKHISEISGDGIDDGVDLPTPKKPKHISEISGPKPTTWKRLPPEKQKELHDSLLQAVEKAKRYDFHGALAPILRAAGVDLGSIPSAVAKALRAALKTKRAEARKDK